MKTKFDPRKILGAGLFALPPHAFAFKDDPGEGEGSDEGAGDEGEGDGDGSEDGKPPAEGKGKEPKKDEEEDAQALKDRLAAIEAERKKERAELEKFRKAEEARNEDQKSDIQKAKEAAEAEKAKREKAEAELLALRVRDAIRTEALSAGANSTRMDAILRMVNVAEVLPDEKGEIVGAKAAIAAIKAEVPELFRGKSTISDDSGEGKDSDRSTEPKTDYELGKALAKSAKESQGKGRL